MLNSLGRKFILFYPLLRKDHTIWRNVRVRNVPRKEVEPKLLKGHVMTRKDDSENDFIRADNYDDFKTKMKRMFVEDDELKMEEALTNDEEYSSYFEKSSEMYDMHVMNDKEFHRKIRKNIIKRKYFKNEAETNLLTYAAKKQIRDLHQLNPSEWSPQKLSESFPISANGVKKLLKNNFVHKSSERIKEHDDQVRQRWEMLKSDQFSDEISPITQALWKEGKLLQEHYAGNPSITFIPDSSIDAKTSQIKKQDVGEHLAIVKKFLDYKKHQVETTDSKKSSESDDDTITEEHLNDKLSKVRKDIFPHLRLRYPSSVELEDQNSASYLASKKSSKWEPEIPYSQFQSNLKEELEIKKNKTTVSEEFQSWMKKEEAEYKMQTPRSPYSPSNFFTKIQKYEKKSFEFNKDYDNKQHPAVYYYDEHKGYQYPVGKSVKGKIRIPPQKYKKGSMYKVNRCVYDENGELLYRLPTNVDST